MGVVWIVMTVVVWFRGAAANARHCHCHCLCHSGYECAHAPAYANGDGIGIGSWLLATVLGLDLDLDLDLLFSMLLVFDDRRLCHCTAGDVISSECAVHACMESNLSHYR